MAKPKPLITDNNRAEATSAVLEATEMVEAGWKPSERDMENLKDMQALDVPASSSSRTFIISNNPLARDK